MLKSYTLLFKLVFDLLVDLIDLVTSQDIITFQIFFVLSHNVVRNTLVILVGILWSHCEQRDFLNLLDVDGSTSIPIND